MTKARLKFVLFLLGLAAFVPLAFAGVALLTQFVAAFQQGADPASIFRGHALVVPAADEARWLDWDEAAGSTPSLAQREELIAAYWLAWEALGRAYETGDTSDLVTYWAGAAYQQALTGMGANGTQQHSGHQLRLTYFSEDGSTAAFEDQHFRIERTLNGVTARVQASAAVVMTLDQGFWRIRSITLHYEPNQNS